MAGMTSHTGELWVSPGDCFNESSGRVSGWVPTLCVHHALVHAQTHTNTHIHRYTYTHIDADACKYAYLMCTHSHKQSNTRKVEHNKNPWTSKRPPGIALIVAAYTMRWASKQVFPPTSIKVNIQTSALDLYQQPLWSVEESSSLSNILWFSVSGILSRDSDELSLIPKLGCKIMFNCHILCIGIFKECCVTFPMSPCHKVGEKCGFLTLPLTSLDYW